MYTTRLPFLAARRVQWEVYTIRKGVEAAATALFDRGATSRFASAIIAFALSYAHTLTEESVH